MNNKEYLNKLIEQFKLTRGITDNVYTVEFMTEFKEWLFLLQLLGDEYGRGLDRNCIYFGNEKYAEVGKGPKDSIAIMYEDMDTTIISPYFNYYLKLNPYRNIINANFKVTGDIPTTVKDVEYGEAIDVEVIKPKDIEVFMTHNPYNLDTLTNWIELHNNPNNGIIVGMFGYTYDKDYSDKIEYMESLRKGTIIPYKYDSYTIGDKYFSMFSTDMYEKGKTYTKKR